MKKIICGDSRKMDKIGDNEVDLIITSPYYRNAIDYDGHLSDEWYRGKVQYSTEVYLQEMAKHFEEAYRVVREGGFCCVIIGNEIDTVNGYQEPLPSYFTTMMTRELKWHLHEELIWYKVTRRETAIQGDYQKSVSHLLLFQYSP